MNNRIIAWTAAFGMMLGLTTQANSGDNSLNMKDGSSDSFVLTSAAVLGGLGAVATAVLGSAAGALASGVIGKLLSAGKEPALVQKAVEKMVEESVIEAEASANALDMDTINLEAGAAQKMTSDDLVKRLTDRGFSPEKIKSVMERAKERFRLKAAALEKEIDESK